MNPIEYIKNHVVFTTNEDCWIWQGGSSRYPTIRIDTETGETSGKHKPSVHSFSVHRWLYEHCFGKITDKCHLDHLCENKRCVNPNHLEAVSQTENTRRVFRRNRMRRAIEDCKAFFDLIPFEMLSENGWFPSETALLRGKIAQEEVFKLIDEFNLLQGQFEFQKEIKFDDLY